MYPVPILIIAIILAMDAFVLSMAQGLRTAVPGWSRIVPFACFLGLFQGAMLITGWFSGLLAGLWFAGWYPWLASVILLAVGFSRIRCGWKQRGRTFPKDSPCCRLSFMTLALVLSLDAFAVGLGQGLTPSPMILLVILVTLVTAVMVGAGMILGRLMGDVIWMRSVSECAGGMLILALAVRSMPYFPV
ncbi:manganese efflux pump MntP family protein [Desulfobotulus sp. H1]|uniref:Manganese efflux pump MntP family protein n=1 Tax=Desulfobotulus pelophilus TaxID=2823377 RepID=A0ABT3NCE6_9BACT|nr:manganese efflux pump [Desulfobotulus pelophilus]MCW7754622.1 manganese efflux pump MntP family protein [Desulfobotulus pelophilus]